jgi:hypothetical protein
MITPFWSASRASELLGATCRDADPGQQLIAVIRKGTRHLQQLPASPDAFVWLRLYQAQLHRLVPAIYACPARWSWQSDHPTDESPGLCLACLSYDAQVAGLSDGRSPVCRFAAACDARSC